MSDAPWIFADASAIGIVRFAASSARSGVLESPRTMPSDDHATFTDALLAYARETGIRLRGAECVVAVAGIAGGDAIPVMRSRWTISRPGLAAVLDRPATILNDVAAMAWSLVDGARIEPIGGGGMPDLSRPGRWAMVLLDDGIGTAALDIAVGGHCTVIDGEAGHMGFSPRHDADFRLMQQWRGGKPHVSWETVLTCGCERHDESWAGLAGSFAGDVMLGLGAWSGVIVTGRHAADLRHPARQGAFSQGLQAKTCYVRHLVAASRGILAMHDPLAGCHAMLRVRNRMPIEAPRHAA